MTDEQTPAEDMPFEADDAAQEIEALKLEVAQLKEQALRYAAEAENTKRRAEREMNDARAYAIQKFARDLLGAADNLGRATAHSPKDSTDPAVKNFIIGVEMTEKELQSAFERNGLKKIDPAKGFALITSRCSVEMVQKTAALRAPVLIAISAPTALAIRTAAQAGITLIGIARDEDFEIFTRPDRVAEGVSLHV